MFPAAYFAPRYFAPRYWPKHGAAPPIVVTSDGGDAFKRRRLTAAERKAIAETERLWEAHKAKRIAEDRAHDDATTARLDEIMDRHLGIVRPKEPPPAISVDAAISGLPVAVARGIDLGALESDLSEIRRLLADHASAVAEIERRRVEQGEIEMLVLGML